MATNDPIWSYGESRLINSSGAITDPDSAWNYGENKLKYEQPGSGEWCWGHDTGVAEEYIGNLVDGIGTSIVSGTGNNEYLTIGAVKYWLFPAVQTGTVEIEITYDKYQAGSGSGSIQYRTGANKGACETAAWNDYTSHFTSLEWIQVKTLVKFVPSGSPIGWWSADAITGLEDNDPVGTFPDQSGNGNDLVQANADKKPTYQTKELHELHLYPIVRFDGGDDVMQIASLGITQPETVFFVIKPLGNVANDCYFDGMAAGVLYCACYQDGVHTNTKFYAGSIVTAVGTAGVPNWGIYVALFKDVSSNFRYNGGSLVTGNAGTRDADGFTLGARKDGTYSSEIDVAEVIVYDNEESPATNETGLNTKYEIY